MNALEAAKVAQAAIEDKLGNLLVHLFNREDREFYGLDHVWGDAPTL